MGFRLQELNQDANSRVSVFLKLWNYEPKNHTQKTKGFKGGTKQLSNVPEPVSMTMKWHGQAQEHMNFAPAAKSPVDNMRCVPRKSSQLPAVGSLASALLDELPDV